MNEMLFMNERFSPSSAVPMSVTVTIPMTMPNVVRTERSLFARIALHEMPSPSLSSEKGFMRRGLRRHRSRCNGYYGRALRRRVGHVVDCGCRRRHALVTGNEAVTNPQDAPRVPGHVLLVCHHEDGIAAFG